MPSNLTHRSERLRVARLFLNLAFSTNKAVFGSAELGTHLDSLFIVVAITLAHAENRLMNVSKLSHYLGLSRATVSRRLEELIALGLVQRIGSYYHIAPARYERVEHLARMDKLIAAACSHKDCGNCIEKAVPKPGIQSVFDNLFMPD